MKEFIGRKKELQLLNSSFNSNESHFIPIYGRRRVGKSELILQFMTDKPSLYFLGKQAPEQYQIEEFLTAASESLENPLLAELKVDTWKRVLTLVVDEYKKKGEKLVLALDEFQWIVESSPMLPSIIQELWDRDWCNDNSVVFILCGSYLGFMEKEVLGSKSPLFGRRTANILLKPFSFREAGEFHPRWSIEDKAKAYFICGGIPYYLRFFNEMLSIDQNIRENFLNEYAALFREADFLLREELRDLEKYSGILMAISQKTSTVKELGVATGIPEKSIPYYLENLKALHLVNGFAPLTTSGEKKRGVRYRLEDNFLRFWFRFVYPNLSLIASLGAEGVFTHKISPRLSSWYGYSFEKICREAIPQIYKNEGVISPFLVGEYWDRSVQIDLVGVREDGRVDIGECKWGEINSIPALIKEIEQKVEKYPNSEEVTIQKRLFVKKWNSEEPSNIMIHTLKNLYED